MFKTFLYSGAAVGYLKLTFWKSIVFFSVKFYSGLKQLSIKGFRSITLKIVLPANLAAWIPWIWGNAAIKLKNPVIRAIKTVKTVFESYDWLFAELYF